MKKKISAIVAEHKAAHPALVALIEGADASILAAEVELVESASAEEQCREAAKTAMATLLESDGFDASRQQKFAELFKPAAKKPEPTQQPPATDKALLESVQAIGTRLERIEKDATISRVLDSHGLSRAGIGAERVKLLESLADEAAMGNVIKDWPPNVRGQRPPFSQTQTLTESAGNHAAPEVPKTREGIRSLYLSSRR